MNLFEFSLLFNLLSLLHLFLLSVSWSLPSGLRVQQPSLLRLQHLLSGLRGQTGGRTSPTQRGEWRHPRGRNSSTVYLYVCTCIYVSTVYVVLTLLMPRVSVWLTGGEAAACRGRRRRGDGENRSDAVITSHIHQLHVDSRVTSECLCFRCVTCWSGRMRRRRRMKQKFGPRPCCVTRCVSVQTVPPLRRSLIIKIIRIMIVIQHKVIKPTNFKTLFSNKQTYAHFQLSAN